MLIHFKRLLFRAFLVPALVTAQDSTTASIELFARGPGGGVRVKI